MIMKAKKLLSMILIGAASVSLLAGCGSNTSDTQADSEDAAQTESSDNTAQADEQESAEDNEDSSSGSGNVLVVYYSATGNTEEVANYIADTTGGDLFELEPVEPYTDDDLNWSDDNSRVSQEHEDESLRDVELVSTDVENWDSYDTVFIGYPKIQYGFLSVQRVLSSIFKGEKNCVHREREGLCITLSIDHIR